MLTLLFTAVGSPAAAAGALAGASQLALSAALASSQYGGWALIGAGVFGACAVAAVRVRGRRQRESERSIPLIVAIESAEPAAPVEPPAPVAAAPAAAPLAAAPPDAAPPVPLVLIPASREAPRAAPRHPRPSRPRTGGVEPLEPSEGETIQILPGRLEVIEGADPGSDFVFVRMGSLDVPEVTLGQSEGPPFRHVRLPAPSVDPVHARMRFEDGHWKIANVSARSAISVNFKQLQPRDHDWALADGDCIRIGDVVLRYWDRRA